MAKKTVKTKTTTQAGGSGVTKKKAAKKTTKAAPKKKTAKASTASTNGALRKPQVRVLQTLAKAKSPLTRQQVADRSKTDNASLTEYLGSTDQEKREANDKKHFPSLISLGYVKVLSQEDAFRFQATAKGKAAAAKV